MSVKIQLEKNGEVTDAFTGFSWTTFIFGFWVPAFRRKSKGFGLFFLFFIIKVIIIYILSKQNNEIRESLRLYGTFETSYSMITPVLLAAAIYPLEVWIAYFYNNYYTNNLLAEGYNLVEDDEYSAAVLKDYSYLPYSKEELEDNTKMEKYRELATFARKEERTKFYVFAGIWGTLLVIIYLLTYFEVISSIK
ncbi:HrgC protein [Fusobacterium canifelinum]|uniref:HrgC protein n=1 Tax=Fusobacterium canifelinum TaxID=285729 RepID=A0ABX7CI68_9FUSO|nr:HrgC protein [Fusobacterium canifelinum]QQS88242.1 HrgC protein [Fusobacterium canifelinum]